MNRTNQPTQKVWVTKHPTRGILEIQAYRVVPQGFNSRGDRRKTRWHTYTLKGNGEVYDERYVHTDKASAEAHLRVLLARRIASLEKQIAKLRGMMP